MGRLLYFAREALRGFYQAKLMTSVSIITVAVSLVVLGIAAVTALTLAEWFEELSEGADIVAYVDEPVAASPAQLRALTRRVAEFAEAFDAAGVTWSVFRSFAGALEHDPDLSTENPMFAMLDQPGIGRHLVPGTPFSFSDAQREDPRPAPRLGEHTEEILGDVAGLPDSEIAALFDEGIVARPEGRSRLAS